MLDRLECLCCLKLAVHVDDVHDLVQKPLVDFGQVVNTVDVVVFVKQSLAHGQPSAVRWVGQGCVQVVKLGALNATERWVHLTNGLLEGLFERTANGHHFTDRFHGRADVPLDMLELGQVPARNLGHNVIQRGLEVGSGCLCHWVGQLGQCMAQGDFRCGVSQWIACGLGGQSRRPGKTSVDLDDTEIQSVWLQGVLNVTFAHHAQMADDFDRSTSQHMVFLVRQCLRGRNNNRVTCVDSERVKVLHVAHGDTVSVLVPHNLIFHFFPALKRLLHENLRGQGQRLGGQVTELLFGRGKARPKPAQGVGRTHNDRISNVGSGFERCVHGFDSDRLGDRNVDFFKRLCEQITVLGRFQRQDWRAKHLDAIPVKNTHFV